MRRWVGQVAAVLGVWALGWTTGCGTFFVYPGSLPGGGGSSTGDYVYVANAATGTLVGFSVGTGKLTAVSGSPQSLGFVPTAVAVNPANTIVFVAGNSGINGFINLYSIGSGGALSLLNSNNIGVADEVSIVFCTQPGSKLSAVGAGAPVAFEVDDSRALYHAGWSVVVKGNAREVTDHDELDELRRGPLHSWATQSTEHWVRIDIEEITGRRIPES